ncbi:MAG: DUF1549 domain-containing protein [Planctomycetes bacterium]|nr:DUF1549 domain-containing protein [Planctomycetota bacterium]
MDRSAVDRVPVFGRCLRISGAFFLFALIAIGSVNPFAGIANAAETRTVDFVNDIRPILGKCVACHGGVKKNADLSMLTRERLLAPTEYGEPAVVVGDASASRLIERIVSDDPDERMPPEEPLEPEEIATLKAWIDQGLPWPTHWSYELPAAEKWTGDASGQKGQGYSVDFFVHRQLAELKIAPSEAADRRTLIRRLSLDLTGLLPTVVETEAFVNDQRPDAYTQLVDRLLASPHHGERWARHWLDEARYADSEGYEKDSPKNDAYRFRDWVIQSINKDMPFDEFTIAQIAGDLLPDRTDDHLIATKFHLQTQFNLEGGVDAEEDRTKRVIDRISTIGTVWLAATIGCCQCHDHPYDPISGNDFYAMYAFFDNVDFAAKLLDSQSKDAEAHRKERKEKMATLTENIKKQYSNKSLSNTVQAQLTNLRTFDNQKGFVRYLEERTEDRRTTYKFRRGNFLQLMVEDGAILPNTPAILPPVTARGEVPDRLDLAHWLVAPDNPLVASVTVNKIWMHLFGQPLAGAPVDYGSKGEAASNPELLDWLAYWFVHEGGWSRKALIRLIVDSDTYRQSSTIRTELAESDPNNKLLARQNRFRVEGEILRDIALQTAGQLSRKIGGPSVFPPLPAIIVQQTYAGSFKYKASEGDGRYRRGLYTFFRRTAIDPNLSTFDCPDSSMTKPQRSRSNNATQALALLQNEVFHEAAQGFARRLLELSLVGGLSDGERLRQGYLIAIGREPEEAEIALLEGLLLEARNFYKDHPDDAVKLTGPHQVDDIAPAENAAWVATTRVIMNMDEFVTRN